jgi:hypothetical protein
MGEITAPGALTVALQGVDTVVHMAYEVKPGGTLADMHEANVVGTRTLLDAAEAAGITRVVAGRFVPTVDLGWAAWTCAISPTASYSRPSAAVPASVTSYVPTTLP